MLDAGNRAKKRKTMVNDHKLISLDIRQLVKSKIDIEGDISPSALHSSRIDLLVGKAMLD